MLSCHAQYVGVGEYFLGVACRGEQIQLAESRSSPNTYRVFAICASLTVLTVCKDTSHVLCTAARRLFSRSWGIGVRPAASRHTEKTVRVCASRIWRFIHFEVYTVYRKLKWKGDCVSYSPADIRKLLVEAFSDEEIETLCFDSFPEAQNEFSVGMSKSDKVRRLLDYCQRHGLTLQLFLAIQTTRPNQYSKYFGEVSPSQLQAVLTTPTTVYNPCKPLFANEAMLDQLIANQYEAMRYYIIFALGLIVFGATIYVMALLAGQNLSESLKPLIGLGGGFVASLSVLQFKEVLTRKEKAQVLETIKMGLNTLEQTQGSIDTDSRLRIDNLLWQAIEKTTVG